MLARAMFTLQMLKKNTRGKSNHKFYSNTGIQYEKGHYLRAGHNRATVGLRHKLDRAHDPARDSEGHKVNSATVPL